MIKIGAITVGQSPRVDVTADILPILGENIQLVEAGGLDGLTREQIAAFTPDDPSEYVLVSRLTDGSSVTFAEKYVLPRMQQCIHRLEEEGVRLIVFFCTGEFPAFQSKVPLIYPNQLLYGVVPALTTGERIITFTPSPLQVEQSRQKWGRLVKEVLPVAVSPYDGLAGVVQAAQRIKDEPGDLIVLDCIGYTCEMKREVARITGKNVVLSRTLLARVVAELGV